jgi:hypothetical protein
VDRHKAEAKCAGNIDQATSELAKHVMKSSEIVCVVQVLKHIGVIKYVVLLRIVQ